jgi:diguanylate cyclase (GGDEF)-like protein
MFEYLSRTVDCKTSEELAAVIAHYCDDYLWLCLNMDFYDNNAAKKTEGNSFTDKMNLFMMCHDKEVSSNRTFERKNLIPDLEAALDEHKYLMFTPLHFQDEVMGYAAVAFNSKDFVFSNTHRVINNTNQIFESFKNRQRLQAAYAEMAEMHMRDPMTGIYNRRGFYTNAKTLLKKGSDENMSTIIFSVDLDGLKDINDTYGHDMGDRAIKAVSDILSSFSSENAICSRFGGDEFILLAIDSEAGCCREKITAQINKAVDVWNDTHDKPFILRISLGCSAAQKCSEDMLEEIIKTADMQMYEQKRRHKARYKIMHNS